MRITNRYLAEQSLRDINSILGRMSRVRNQITSGKQITAPSDSPADAARILKLNEKLTAETQYVKNINSGISQLESSCSMLGQVEDMLAQIYDIAQQHSDDSSTSVEKQAAAMLVNAYLEDLVTKANTNYLGSHIYGGTQTSVVPFTAEYGDSMITGVSQNSFGVDGTRKIEVDVSQTMQINLTGEEIFQPSGAGANDDVFQTVIALREALDNNDTASIKQAIGDLEDSISQVIRADTLGGERINMLESKKLDLESNLILSKAARSELQDTDYAKAMVELSVTENMYQAALKITASMIDYSLVNFIR
jgi:flagellar hook-associated protein 3 FlgL